MKGMAIGKTEFVDLKVARAKAFLLGLHVEPKNLTGAFFKLVAIDIIQHREIDRLAFGTIDISSAAGEACAPDQLHIFASSLPVTGMLLFSKRFISLFTLQRKRLSVVGKVQPLDSVCPGARGLQPLQNNKILVFKASSLFIMRVT